MRSFIEREGKATRAYTTLKKYDAWLSDQFLALEDLGEYTVSSEETEETSQ